VKKIFLLFAALMPIVSVAATHVAVLETVSEKGVIGRSEKMFLTDELRKQAKNMLPEYMGFVVMTRENISAMLPPGKSVEECEGACLVETGKNIAADYVAQARVGKFGKQLTLTMELYETAGNNLVGSFTARKADAEGLLEEIEKKVGAVFQMIAGASVPLTGGNRDVGGQKNYTVHVKSIPAGALFSTDGRVNASCNKTPCDIKLVAGNHHFYFSLDTYFDKEESVNIRRDGQTISAELVSNFGELTLIPVFVDGMGKIDEAEILVDGMPVKETSHRLSVGNHKVQISHRCYETVSFNAAIKPGGKFSFNQKIPPLMGGLKMHASLEGKPKVLPVYVNGKKVGETPLLKTVPVCAKVQVDKDMKVVPVMLKTGETVEFTYKVGNEVRLNADGKGFLIDNRDGRKYKIVKIGKQVWMAENLNFEVHNSYCYKDNPTDCQKFGRFYIWSAAIDSIGMFSTGGKGFGLGTEQTPSGTIRGICPEGWHLPSEKEFEILVDAVGGADVAGKKLKSTSGWHNNGNGDDAFGFTALPIGNRDAEYFVGQGYWAKFWGSTGRKYIVANILSFNQGHDGRSSKEDMRWFALPVRCLKD